MSVRLVVTFLKDLFAVLPGRADEDWEDLDALSGDRPTVILISGFAATRRSVSVMRKRLRKDGFNVLVLSLDWHTLSDSVRGLYRMAERLSTLALRIRKDRDLSRTKIYLVAHSAGGLVARYYVQLLGGSHYCDALFTLGTPHHGTWVAALGLFTHLILKARCLFHMLPVSPFIRHINEAPWPDGFRMVSISSRGDYLSYRRAAALPEGLVEGHAGEIVVHELGGLSHSDFLLSKRSYATLRKFLKPDAPKETETLGAERSPA